MGKSRDSPTRETREPLGDLTFKARIIKIEVSTPCFFKKKKNKNSRGQFVQEAVHFSCKCTQKHTKTNKKKTTKNKPEEVISFFIKVL